MFARSSYKIHNKRISDDEGRLLFFSVMERMKNLVLSFADFPPTPAATGPSGRNGLRAKMFLESQS